LHIIETSAPIPNKFCTVTKTQSTFRGWFRHVYN